MVHSGGGGRGKGGTGWGGRSGRALLHERDRPPAREGPLVIAAPAYDAGGAREVDYVHGDDALEQLASAAGCAGLHLATLGKSELIGRVARHGPLPRKTFSMGEADEKRFYVEARRIR
mgnify:CR=1 FL=1